MCLQLNSCARLVFRVVVIAMIIMIIVTLQLLYVVLSLLAAPYNTETSCDLEAFYESSSHCGRECAIFRWYLHNLLLCTACTVRKLRSCFVALFWNKFLGHLFDHPWCKSVTFFPAIRALKLRLSCVEKLNSLLMECRMRCTTRPSFDKSQWPCQKMDVSFN